MGVLQGPLATRLQLRLTPFTSVLIFVHTKAAASRIGRLFISCNIAKRFLKGIPDVHMHK